MTDRVRVHCDANGQFLPNSGFARALKFYELGLRTEGNREWNWQMRGLSDRRLIAAAEFARQRSVLDRMISTSDRTKSEFDFTQRFPTPFRESLVQYSAPLGLDENWVLATGSAPAVSGRVHSQSGSMAGTTVPATSCSGLPRAADSKRQEGRVIFEIRSAGRCLRSLGKQILKVRSGLSRAPCEEGATLRSLRWPAR